MKKIRLIGMFALTFALVFGAGSCKNDEDEGPWGDSLAEVLKEEGDKFLKADWVFDKDAQEVDISFYVNGEEADASYYTENFSSSVSHMFPKTIAKEDAVDFAKSLLNTEKQTNESYKKGPVKYGDSGTMYAEMSVMVNGDRNVIRIEQYNEMIGEEAGIPMELYSNVALEYKKK